MDAVLYWRAIIGHQNLALAHRKGMRDKGAVRLMRGAMFKPDGTQQVVRSRGRVLNPEGKPF
jgi:hypothetical protein